MLAVVMKYKVCKLSDVEPEVPLAVEIEGLPPLVVFNVSGEYYVTDNTCTHGAAFMSDGFQDGHIAECPFHGGAFDIRNGEPVAAPCKIPLKAYRTYVEGDEVWIEV